MTVRRQDFMLRSEEKLRSTEAEVAILRHCIIGGKTAETGLRVPRIF